MEHAQHHHGPIDFSIGPDLLSFQLGEEVALSCTITNLLTFPFRLKRAWDFTLPGHAHGTLSCDILLEGKIYESPQQFANPTPKKRWTPDEIVALKKGESHHFTANLSAAYPLLQEGTYTIQACFEPEKLSGVQVSKCRPILSNLITVVIC
jgi:hypothetical protein